ncbi:hypothetical protein AB9F26_17145 [Falsihalocynthiibacter sp. BN13B15]
MPRVQVKQDAFLYFDMARHPQEQWNVARNLWALHRDAMLQSIRGGKTPGRAVYDYMRRHNTNPHLPNQLPQALARVRGPDGNPTSAWKAPTLQQFARTQRGNQVMTDTFGAVTTLIALAVTADDWTQATPEEWDSALNAGAVAQLAGQVVSNFQDGRAAAGAMNIVR